MKPSGARRRPRRYGSLVPTYPMSRCMLENTAPSPAARRTQVNQTFARNDAPALARGVPNTRGPPPAVLGSIACDVLAQPLARNPAQRALRSELRKHPRHGPIPLRVAPLGRYGIRLCVERGPHDLQRTRRLNRCPSGCEVRNGGVEPDARTQREVSEVNGLIAGNRGHIVKRKDDR